MTRVRCRSTSDHLTQIVTSVAHTRICSDKYNYCAGQAQSCPGAVEYYSLKNVNNYAMKNLILLILIIKGATRQGQ